MIVMNTDYNRKENEKQKGKFSAAAGGIVREFQPADTEQIMNIWLEGNLDAHPFVPEAYWRRNFAQVRTQLSQAEISVWDAGGEIYGFVGIMRDYIAGIFVGREYRSQGVGKQLLDFAKQKHHVLTLSVYRKNRRGIRFYEREGFFAESESVDEDTGEREYTMVWRA